MGLVATIILLGLGLMILGLLGRMIVMAYESCKPDWDTSEQEQLERDKRLQHEWSKQRAYD